MGKSRVETPQTTAKAAIGKVAADKAVAEAEAIRDAAKKDAYYQSEKLELQPFLDKAAKLLPELEGKLQAYIQSDLAIIHRWTGLDHFLIGGLWSSAIIAKVVNEWDRCEDLRDYERLELIANDIDVYHGCFTDEDAPFVVGFLDIHKYPVDDLFWELNTVKCRRWSVAGFLENNDINVTASYLEVDLSRVKWVHIHASSRFWKFLFSSNSERTIELVDSYDCSKYSAITCVRMAFKHFQMQMFKLDMADLDATVGTLASSQKDKLDKMKTWDKNPLKAYECKKKKNQNYYYLVAKDNELVCAGCRSSRVNKSCSMVRCKKCCIKHCLKERKMCKCKDHQKGTKERKQMALEELAEAGILDEVDMEEMIEDEQADSE
jgi:hypothetical protein